MSSGNQSQKWISQSFSETNESQIEIPQISLILRSEIGKILLRYLHQKEFFYFYPIVAEEKGLKTRKHIKTQFKYDVSNETMLGEFHDCNVLFAMYLSEPCLEIYSWKLAKNL